MSIRFACPACETAYTLSDHTAGREVDCPKCGQRLRVPTREPVPAIADVPAAPIYIACPYCGHQAQGPVHFAGKEAKCPKCRQSFVAPSLSPLPVAEPEPAPVVEYRRPDWDVDEWGDDRPLRRHRRLRPRERVGFRCPYCNTSAMPRWESKVSVAGWICFWMLLIFLCFPLCWIGLLMKEHRSVCARCGVRLD